MESLSTCLSEQTIRQIGWVLVHFLWQGCTVGAVLWAVLKILNRASSNTRYLAACAGMMLMMTAPVVTFTVLNEPEPITPAPQVFVEKTFAAAETFQETTVAAAETISTEIQQIPLGDILSEKLEAALPWCVIGWAAGVAALSLWYLGGWCQLQKLRLIGTKPASEQITAPTANLARRLGITRAVRITESMLVQVPTMIGWLKPVILLPATAVTGLDEMQLRAMIAHELAHIKRHDYLVNIIQTAFEILGFYHPAVWWMSKQVRIERENCCDDMAAELVQDRTAYARALFSMEEIRIQQLSLAMRASGGSLIDRIGRLVGKHETPRSKSGWVPTAITFGLLIALISGIAFTAQSTNIEAGERILHFPADRSIGMVKIKDSHLSRQIMSFAFWLEADDWWNRDWEYLAEAQGDVKIPAGKLAALYVNKSGWEDLSPLSALRPDDLHMLSFSNNDVQRPRDKCMPHVAHLTGLKVLNLWFTDIGTEGMSHITKLQELEYLRLPDRMTNRGLAYAAELKNLKGLYFQKNTVTDAGLSLLKNMQSLEELMLGGERISDEGLAHLADLKRLTYLWISSNISDAGLAHLRKVESLKILNLTRLAITDKGLAHLGSLPHLENLCLYGTNITDAGLVHLKKLPLKKLELRGTQVTAAGFASLADMPSLEYLDLPREIATDEGLRHLGRLTNLKHLRLPTVHYVNPAMDKRLYTDAGLAHLTNLRSLESLFVGGLGVTDAGMEHVAKLTNLRKLNLFGCPITNNGLARLTSLKKLTSFNLYESKVTIGGLKQLNSLTDLEDLDVHSAARDGQPLDISGLKKLVMLSICTPFRSDEKILDEDLACLADLRNLKGFQIASHPSNPRGLTDSGTAHLKALTNMDRLTIGGPELTDQSLANLADMKKLDMLNIYGGRFTDKGLEHLEKLKSLQYLRLPGEHRFTPDGLKRLRSQLPNLLLLETDQQRSRSMGGGARAQTTAVNSNDPNEQPLVSAAAFAASESNRQQSAGEARQYAVNRTVAEFAQAEDFSTPESAYAAINRVMASGSREGWMRVSTKASAERIAQSMQQDQPVPAEWAKVVLNARILKVLIQDDRAMVIAEFGQDLSSQKIVNPIDARSLKLEDGRWLNAGEDRFDTVEQAAKKFGAIVEREDKTEHAYRTALDDPSRFQQMAEELFDKLRSADYEEILSYYDTYSGHWRQDGWKKLGLNYTVYTDWPSFAAWVCRTFRDNPITSVELDDAILSEKEFDGHKSPAVPYTLTLKDSQILQGELYFTYRASSGTWQPAEGIDWHLQDNPAKQSKGGPGGGMGGFGGGMGGSGGAPISDPQDQIIFPKNWNEIAQAQGEDPNRLSANFKSINGMQIVVYDITDFLAGSFDQDYLPGQAGVNRAAERLIKEIEAIVPESWRSNGGQGQVNVHGTTKLMIRQTPEVHEKIADHLAQRRIQVAIEARFILADDSFEQSMGFEEDAKEKGRVTEGLANSDEIKAAMQTKPLAERDLPAVSSKPSAESGLYSFDSKTERLIIRAVQSFKNAKTLTAPKALVMNSESASMRVGNTHTFVDAANETREIDQGVVLDLLPVVQDDNKTILLKTHIQVTNILDERAQVIGGKEYSIPWVQVTTIPFQAQVESGGTILVRGPEVGVKNEQTGELEKQRLFVLLKLTALAAPEDK